MKFDLHIHTIHSPDSRNKVEDIIKTLQGKGFSGAAFVDHNTPKGSREAFALNIEGFVVIPGIEVSTEEGHILALNVTEPIKRAMGVLETIDEIHAQGGIAVAAHPYRYWSGLGEENVIGKPFDAIEALNGRSAKGSNVKARCLAKNLDLPIVGGSDSHENKTLGSGYTIFPDGCDTVEKAIKAILKGQTDVGGKSRTATHTLGYVNKSVSKWLGRGMKRM